MKKLLKVKKPFGYQNTNLSFSSPDSAQKYTESLKNDFLLQRAKTLEFLLSKRKKKDVIHSRPKKYLLTKEGSKYNLWEKMK